jgi:hypothetical protein
MDEVGKIALIPASAAAVSLFPVVFAVAPWHDWKKAQGALGYQSSRGQCGFPVPVSSRPWPRHFAQGVIDEGS